MGLLDNTTQSNYYRAGDHGNYQFTSLDDVITQFQIAYVGEDKIISKIKRADVAFMRNELCRNYHLILLNLLKHKK